LTDQGGKRTVVNVEECPDEVIQFEMPVPPEEQEAETSKLSGAQTSEAAKAAPSKDQPKPRMSVLRF